MILAVETATGCGSVSLTQGAIDDGRILGEYTNRPDITHSRRLLGSIDQLLENAGISWDDIDGLAISLGPGSFTGLRIGMAAVKGIAMATGLPLVGVPTLDGLAVQCCGLDKPVCCLLDARKKQVYGAFYTFGADHFSIRTSDFFVLSPEELLTRINEPTLLAGPGILEYRELFLSAGNVDILPGTLAQPRASAVGFLGAKLLGENNTVDPATVAPLYVRASEAELNLKKQQSLR